MVLSSKILQFLEFDYTVKLR